MVDRLQRIIDGVPNYSKLSDNPGDKLEAALNYDWPDPIDVGVNFQHAAAAWFAGLSDRDVIVAAKAAYTYRRSDRTEAERLASQLPPAPVFPLS